MMTSRIARSVLLRRLDPRLIYALVAPMTGRVVSSDQIGSSSCISRAFHVRLSRHCCHSLYALSGRPGERGSRKEGRLCRSESSQFESADELLGCGPAQAFQRGWD
ncbi:hypothetical protein HPP92_003055 [Vanilla planifolia]|uniref:Uncharacterized protein n=1 Tax=Vanilla planifolia TaxID=51239 RepID=A0A835SFW5_VANPL|nr:hypothetical protein HPP92_003055 [Vanilla planifolia]